MGPRRLRVMGKPAGVKLCVLLVLGVALMVVSVDGNSISGAILAGYTDNGSSMKENWVSPSKSLQGMLTGLEACQSGLEACQKIAEMGPLTVDAGSVNSSSVPSMLKVEVKGTWTKNGIVKQCALQAKASFVTCPNIHDYTTATCAKCTIGYGQFSLNTFVDVKKYPACVLWFTWLMRSPEQHLLHFEQIL